MDERGWLAQATDQAEVGRMREGVTEVPRDGEVWTRGETNVYMNLDSVMIHC